MLPKRLLGWAIPTSVILPKRSNNISGSLRGNAGSKQWPYKKDDPVKKTDIPVISILQFVIFLMLAALRNENATGKEKYDVQMET